MCIAAIIFKPVSLHYLLDMEDSNPDGGGVAWQHESEKTICFKRGLTATDIFAMQEEGKLTYPYLLHFRWATHGAKTPELTHPFPVGIRALLGELEGTADQVLIHNGTWNTYSMWLPEQHSTPVPQSLIEAMSDTAIAAWLAEEDPNILDDVPWATAHAYMRNGEMDITTRGSWQEHQENWYSNLFWLPWSGRNYAWSTQSSRTSKDNGTDKWWEDELPGACKSCGFRYFCSCNGEWKQRSEQEKKGESEPKTTEENLPKDWDLEEYLKWRYPNEVKEIQKQLQEAEAKETEEDSELISDEAAVVNAYLARQDEQYRAERERKEYNARFTNE